MRNIKLWLQAKGAEIVASMLLILGCAVLIFTAAFLGLWLYSQRTLFDESLGAMIFIGVVIGIQIATAREK
jgi:hypothetical protein